MKRSVKCLMLNSEETQLHASMNQSHLDRKKKLDFCLFKRKKGPKHINVVAGPVIFSDENEYW